MVRGGVPQLHGGAAPVRQRAAGDTCLHFEMLDLCKGVKVHRIVMLRAFLVEASCSRQNVAR